MKKLIFFIVILLGATGVNAIEWSQIGPTTTVYQYRSTFAGDVLCGPDGMTIGLGDDWLTYSYGQLPIWDAAEIYPDYLLVIMGDGSWSDGVYEFNLDTHEFTVREWIYNPRFLFQHNNAFYVGGESGLNRSTDNGQNWVSATELTNVECYDMAASAQHLFVSSADGLFRSADNGQTWELISTVTIPLQQLACGYDGTLYGIFPGVSNSSGLWSSTDAGTTWNVEFYSDLMSDVHLTGGFIFVSWDQGSAHQGVAIWDDDATALIWLNEGLPNLNVCQLSENTMIDCPNIVTCTEAGTFITCDLFQLGIEETPVIHSQPGLTNYPNPFNPTTTIVFSLDRAQPVSIKIYNAAGQLVTTLFDGKAKPGLNRVQWNARDAHGDCLASGMYVYRLITPNVTNANRMLLLK